MWCASRAHELGTIFVVLNAKKGLLIVSFACGMNRLDSWVVEKQVSPVVYSALVVIVEGGKG